MFSREKLFLGVKPEKNRFKVALPFKGRGWITEITEDWTVSSESHELEKLHRFKL